MISFEKYHGAGNDFILISKNLDQIPDRSILSIKECNREEGIGADGILFLTTNQNISNLNIVMDLRQPDGSIGSMCGNALRCVAKWASDSLNISSMIIETPAGTFSAQVSNDQVTTTMGMASFETINIPVTSDSFTLDQELFGFNITLVNTGAPHAVIFVDNIDEISLPSKAFEIRNSSIFPLGINVTFAQKTKTGFKQKTFEKGVEGFTLACGTGAVAIASVLHHFKNLQYDVPIQIKQHGGENLTVLIQKNGEAILKGPAIKQFSGELHV